MSTGITLGVSGLDTETLISELMQVERQPLYNPEAKRPLFWPAKGRGMR